MEKKEVKEAYRSAEKELKDNQIKEVKEVIKRTLEKVDDLKKKKREIEEEIKILRLDLENFREGRLDLVEERQKKSKKAEETSIVKVVKVIEHHYHYDRWYEPYHIYWYPQPYFQPDVMCGTTDIADYNLTASDTITDAGDYTATTDNSWTTINCSIAKYATPGAYSIAGSIINFK